MAVIIDFPAAASETATITYDNDVAERTKLPPRDQTSPAQEAV